MRMASTVALGIALLAGVAGCAMPTSVEIDCLDPDGAEAQRGECDEVVELVRARFGFGDAQRGALRVVGVQTLDCADAADEEGLPTLDVTEVDRCWRVILHFDAGSIPYFATRSSQTGEIELMEFRAIE